MLQTLMLVIAALFVQLPALAASSTAAVALDFEFFKTKVQPIFLARRGEHARCIGCHTDGNQTPRLQRLSPGAGSWDEEQSRKNFEEVKRLVAPGEPLASRLLMHPLAPAAGGDPFHIGGKHWDSQNDPEWQILAAWVRTGSATPGTAQAASVSSSLDFEFYRSRVEPIFLKPRQQQDEGSGNACVVCHATIATRMRLQPLSPGATTWTDEQSRKYFAVVSRLVTVGEPLKSTLLLHPLAPAAGGSPTLHAGGKFWASQDNPEWQTLASWVRGQTASSK